MATDIIRILLADSRAANRKIFRTAFETVKIANTVQTVTNADELLQVLKDPYSPPPHLLFLDLRMPGKLAIDKLIALRTVERLADLTLVIYSSYASEEEISMSFIQGANIYMSQPPDTKELNKKLLEILTINWQYQTSGLDRENYLFHF